MAGAGIPGRGSEPAQGLGGDVHGEPAGPVALVVPLPVLDEHHRKPGQRDAAAHPENLPLAGRTHGAALGRGGVPDLSKDPGLSGFVEAGSDLGGQF